MLRLTLLAPLLSSLLILANASSLPHGDFSGHFQRHNELARRADGDVQLFRRVSGVRMSFYDVEESGNAGSCGQHLRNNDATVAMNAAQMNPGWCFKTIRISYRGVTRTATISDTCPGCPWGGLDLAMGFFTDFAPQASGTFFGDWEFADATQAPPPPKPTTTKKSTTWQSPTPTPTPTPPPPPPTSSRTTRRSTSTTTSSTSTLSSSTTSATSVDYFSGAASGLAVPTGIIDINLDANLQSLNQVYIQLGAVAMAANRV